MLFLVNQNLFTKIKSFCSLCCSVIVKAVIICIWKWSCRVCAYAMVGIGLQNKENFVCVVSLPTCSNQVNSHRKLTVITWSTQPQLLWCNLHNVKVSIPKQLRNMNSFDVTSAYHLSHVVMDLSGTTGQCWLADRATRMCAALGFALTVGCDVLLQASDAKGNKQGN